MAGGCNQASEGWGEKEKRERLEGMAKRRLKICIYIYKGMAKFGDEGYEGG